MPRFIRWFSTEEELTGSVFELASVGSSNTVCDLGSGDGGLLFAALERGAGECIRIEIDGQLVISSKRSVR